MAKQMIEAGACCLQIENQVADEKQCGHQDGKVTSDSCRFLLLSSSRCGAIICQL
jgi:isocitrate lyase